MLDPGSRRPTVLIVEDEDNVRQSLARYLDAAGYDVLPTGDPDTAFAELRRSSIDALITDVRLADNRSGLEVLEFVHLDEEGRQGPLQIVLTGVVLSPDEEDIIRRYPAYVFYKPYGYAELVQLLNTKLGH
jgi:CheY-like chemotaxis protein